MDKPPHFNGVTRRAFETAMMLLKERFEDVPEIDRLAYHSSAHTFGVVTRAMKIASMLGLTEHERVLVFVASVFHDTVQESETQTDEDGCLRRVRFSGMNELMSAMDAVSFMQSDSYAFTSLDYSVVSHAIIGTTPWWSTDYGTVIQPMVNEQSHIASRVLALADIGEAGMDSEAFLRSSYTLFAEDNIGIVTHVRSVQYASEVNHDQQVLYRKRLLDWLSAQCEFVLGRRSLLIKELSRLGDPRWKIKKELFNQFDLSLRGALKNLEDARKQDFKTLMRRLHPDAFPGMEK